MEKLLILSLVAAAIFITIVAQPAGPAAVLFGGVCAVIAVIFINKNFEGEEKTFLRPLFLVALLLRASLATATYILHLQQFFGGDWSEDRLLPDVFRSLVFGDKLEIRNPHSIRPWQHALEPLAGYLKLAAKLYAGEKTFADAWNFGPADEDSKSVGWILEEIRRIWNEPVNWEIAEGRQPHEARLLKLDSAKAKSDLRWSPKLSLAEAISLTTEWYRAFKNKADLTKTTRCQIEFYMNK